MGVEFSWMSHTTTRIFAIWNIERFPHYYQIHKCLEAMVKSLNFIH